MFTLFFIVSFASIGIPAMAEEQAVQATSTEAKAVIQEKITEKDLGVDNAGILPSNPFYFLKVWARGVKETFTFGVLKKAELQLQYFNEKAAELKKLEEIIPFKTETLGESVDGYLESAGQLENYVDQLKGAAKDSKIEKFFGDLAGYLLKHSQLFDELKSKFKWQPDLEKKLEISREKINGIIAKLGTGIESGNSYCLAPSDWRIPSVCLSTTTPAAATTTVK